MKPDHLYVIGDGSGAVKIGRAASPAKRLPDLQVGSSRPLSLLHIFPDAGSMEREVHDRFAAVNIHREWFDFGDGDPVASVREALDDIAARRAAVRLRDQAFKGTLAPVPDVQLALIGDGPEEIRQLLVAWGAERRALHAERGPLVRESIAAGVTVEAIHQFTGLGRTTIERIREKGGNDVTS